MRPREDLDDSQKIDYVYKYLSELSTQPSPTSQMSVLASVVADLTLYMSRLKSDIDKNPPGDIVLSAVSQNIGHKIEKTYEVLLAVGGKQIVDLIKTFSKPLTTEMDS